jgi:hypothetical protein
VSRAFLVLPITWVLGMANTFASDLS